MVPSTDKAIPAQNIFTIVVTYNRLDWLKRNVAALQQQSKRIDTICIVDNASTDGTREFLQKLEQNDPQIKAIYLDENTGGAGGFHCGMNYAAENAADWFWLMDDDCIPDPDCLKNLLIDFPVNTGALVSPLALSLEDRQTQIWHDEQPLKVNTGLQKTITAPFTGLLVNRQVVDMIGFPDKNFFIYADDVEYSLRAKQSKLKTYTSTNAILYHPYKAVSKIDFKIFKLPHYECSKLRAYYATRNNIICNKRYNTVVKPLSEHYKTLIKLLVAGKLELALLKGKGILDGLNNRVYVKKV